MDRVAGWLQGLDLDECVSVFSEHKISFDVIADITDADLREMGVALGHRKKILRAIAELNPEPDFSIDSNPGADSKEPAPPQSARRQLTVAFYDLVGSTQLSTRVDPEHLAELINEFQDCCRSSVERFGGYIARYMGDGALAYFGYPQASENDAERAVRAARLLLQRVQELRFDRVGPVQARVGIATGLVVVGEVIGKGMAREHVVTGDAPNLAARLQSLAAPDDIVISANTHRLLGDLFQLESLGANSLKGFAEPVPAFRVVDETNTHSRFAALRDVDTVPALGRETQLAKLAHCWQLAQSGRGHVVQLHGLPGIGKSRLLKEFCNQLSDSTIYHQLSCAPHATTTSFAPVINWLQGLLRNQSADTDLAGFEQALWPYSPDAESIQVLNDLIDPGTSNLAFEMGTTAQRLHEQTVSILVAALTAQANQKPLVLIIEDLHWSDPSTLEFLSALIAAVETLPLLLIATFRPEFNHSQLPQPDWISHLELDRFNARASASIAESLAGKDLPQQLLDLIFERTDGVPLYIEELTRALLETGSLRETEHAWILDGRLPLTAIPLTLQDSLMARLDRLGDARTIAQMAAALGRVFHRHRLLQLAGEDNRQQISEALKILQSADLIEPLAATDLYHFKHALVREAAHDSLLLRQRRELHSRIVQLLNTDPQVPPEVLAQHCEEAARYRDAIAHWRTAGTRSIALSANLEAREQLEAALALFEKLPVDQDTKRLELDIRVALGVAQQATLGYVSPAIEENYSRANTLCNELENARERVPVQRGLYVYNLMRGDLSLAHEFGNSLLQAAELSGDDAELVEAYFAIGQTYLFHVGDLTTAHDHLLAGVNTYDELKHGDHGYRYGQDPGVYSLQLLSMTLQLQGFPDQALLRSQQARELASRIGHPLSEASSCVFAAQLHQWRAEPSEVSALANRTLEISQQQALPFFSGWAHVLTGWAEHGDNDHDRDAMRSGLQLFKTAGIGLGFTIVSATYAGALINARQFVLAASTLDDALDHAQRCGEPYIVPELLRLRARLQRHQEPEKAQATLVCAQTAAKSIGARFWLLRCTMDEWRESKTEGREQLYNDKVLPILDEFSEGLSTPDLAEAMSCATAIAVR